MERSVLRIGTRESQLAVWQATLVKNLLAEHGYEAELVYIKSEGDIDLKTPLYEMGVQGIFTRSLDVALINNHIDIAVHSMKDVPTQLPQGIVQAAVLKRASHKDLLVYKGEHAEIEEALDVSSQLSVVGNNDGSSLATRHSRLTIATSSIRRKAQWLNRYPSHTLENLRGNVNSRLRKVEESYWNGAIFAAAGLERINLRPEKSIELDWMLPAPAQGAIMVVCKEEDVFSLDACSYFNDEATALCTKIEKDFLRELMGGCSTPIGALAQINGDELVFKGNIFSIDGIERVDVIKNVSVANAHSVGTEAAHELLSKGGQAIAAKIHHERT
jgi:hydroxymethylbilane synthase